MARSSTRSPADWAPRAELLAEYHQVSARLAVEESDALRQRLDRLHHALEIDGGWRVHQEVEAVISRMSLEGDADVATLSAGMKRRVLLAKALVRGPDILLLDEPTNHLDIEAIGWLEEFLLRSSTALLFVTHDRAFLRRLATRIFELDRGRLTSLVVRLRDLYEAERGGPGGRGPAEGRVRQEAGQGRGLDPHRNPGPADAERRAGAGAGEVAGSPPLPAASSRARSAWRFRRPNGRAGW